MRRKSWAAVTVAAMAALATPGFGGDGEDEAQRTHGCSERTLRGAYGIRMQGTRPAGPGGPIESVVGEVIRFYDGRGEFRQIDNVKGSITGIALDREGFGTYEVNADCTGATLFEPGPGISIQEKLVIVDGGGEVFSVVSSPLPVMVSTVQKKVRGN